jgi:hypothetical protein
MDVTILFAIAARLCMDVTILFVTGAWLCMDVNRFHYVLRADVFNLKCFAVQQIPFVEIPI